MNALRPLWTPTTRLYDRADEGQPRKFVLDCGIAWQNYQDDLGAWREIDLTPEPVANRLRIRKAPYDLTVFTSGERTILPDRNTPSRSIRFPASRFLFNKTFTQVGNSYVWSSNAFDIILRWENSRVKFDVVVKQSVPFDQVQFDVDKTGIDDATLLSFLANLHATDSSPEPIVRPLSVSLSQGVLTLGFDLTGMTLPVTIDPTLDLQVGAGADDAHETDSDAQFSSGSLNVFADSNSATGSRWNAGFRFTNVTVAQGNTINVSYLTVVFPVAAEDSPDADILMEDVDDAVSFVTNADVTLRTRTTASVAWTATNLGQTAVNSPSINAVVQEIVDRVGWVSGNDMVAFMDGRTGTNRFTSIRSYDGSTANAAKLHIEHTAGAAALNLERIERHMLRGVLRGIGRGMP